VLSCTSANPLFQDSTHSNYCNSTVCDSAYSIHCHRVPVPQEHSTDTVHLQYMLHKVTSPNFTKSHHLPHPHPHSTTTAWSHMFPFFVDLVIIFTGPLCRHLHLHLCACRAQLPLPLWGMFLFPFCLLKYYCRSSTCTPTPACQPPQRNDDNTTTNYISPPQCDTDDTTITTTPPMQRKPWPWPWPSPPSQMMVKMATTPWPSSQLWWQCLGCLTCWMSDVLEYKQNCYGLFIYLHKHKAQIQ